ncbi:MAG: hypothetical protein ABWU14_21805 [Limnospira maxima]
MIETKAVCNTNYRVPSYHRGNGGVVTEDFCIHPFHRGFEVQHGLLQLCLMG